jgi:hypothetical protein
MRRSLAALIGLAALASACTGSTGAHGASPSPSVRATVAYQVTGNAPKVQIRYGNKHESREVTVTLPWAHGGSAFTGTTVVLSASQPSSRYGSRITCMVSVTIPGNPPIVSQDSSHIVGIKQEGGPQKILYDGQCNTAQVVSLTGLP